MQYSFLLAAATSALITTTFAIPAPPQITAPPSLERRASQPSAKGSTVLKNVMTIAAGKSFDGGLKMFDRGKSCTGQAEGGDSDAVFILEKGASLSNVIIGPNQIEGIHCNGACTLTNVWWDAVCEDAFTIKNQDSNGVTRIKGGGARGAEDKVIQHNGGGTVIIEDFTVSDFGKLYRSCGNCKSMPARHVQLIGGSATSGKVLIGINTNKGDTASIKGTSISSVKDKCLAYEGTVPGKEPKKLGACPGV